MIVSCKYNECHSTQELHDEYGSGKMRNVNTPGQTIGATLHAYSSKARTQEKAFPCFIN